MAYLKNRDTGTVITRYVTLNKTQDATLTVKTALDGTEYLTRFGAPVYGYKLDLHVNEAGKTRLMSAADTLDELEVCVRSGTFRGRIKSLGAFEQEYYGWYKVEAVLSAESEVNGR